MVTPRLLQCPMSQHHISDFIMVITFEGEVLTVPLHQIERVQVHPATQQAVVLLCTDTRFLILQETAEAFLKRSENLQEALCKHDLSGINHHLAPAC